MGAGLSIALTLLLECCQVMEPGLGGEEACCVQFCPARPQVPYYIRQHACYCTRVNQNKKAQKHNRRHQSRAAPLATLAL